MRLWSLVKLSDVKGSLPGSYGLRCRRESSSASFAWSNSGRLTPRLRHHQVEGAAVPVAPVVEQRIRLADPARRHRRAERQRAHVGRAEPVGERPVGTVHAHRPASPPVARARSAPADCTGGPGAGGEQRSAQDQARRAPAAQRLAGRLARLEWRSWERMQEGSPGDERPIDERVHGRSQAVARVAAPAQYAPSSCTRRPSSRRARSPLFSLCLRTPLTCPLPPLRPPPPPRTSCGRVARELSLTAAQVRDTLALFDAGNTLPFIARYRKEATGGLDEVQLRDVQERADLPHRTRGSPHGDPQEHRRAGQARRRAARRRSGAPTPSRRSRTCTCPSSPSAARAP